MKSFIFSIITSSMMAAIIFCSKLAQAIDCNRIGPCLLNNYQVLQNLMREAQSLQRSQDSTNSNATDTQMQKICATFNPIIDCTGRDEARLCEYKFGKRGQVFRLSYLVILCSITVKMRQCELQEDLKGITPPAPRVCPGQTTTQPPPTTTGAADKQKNICTRQFPDVEEQAKDMTSNSKLGTTPPVPIYADDDDPYAERDFADGDTSGIELNVAKNCTRLKHYIGCWLHYGKHGCNNQAEGLIQQMYNIYNDLTGRKCDSVSPDLINYQTMEDDYVKYYVPKDPECPTLPPITTLPKTTARKLMMMETTIAAEKAATAITTTEEIILETTTAVPATTKPPRTVQKRTTKAPYKTAEDEEDNNSGTAKSSLVISTVLILISTAIINRM